MMYMCEGCCLIFDKPKNYIEKHGFCTPPYEEWSGCPKCGDTYDDAFQCDVCNEWLDRDNVKLSGYDIICKKCCKK